MMLFVVLAGFEDVEVHSSCLLLVQCSWIFHPDPKNSEVAGSVRLCVTEHPMAQGVGED